MGSEPDAHGRGVRTARGWVLAVSALLNVGLALWLAQTMGSRTPASAELRPVGAPHESVAVARVNRAGPRPQAVRPAPPFHWSDLESASYPEYIARLRAAGCPEPVVRDIITADLAHLYAGRAREIWSPAKREYWQKQRGPDRPNSAQLKQLMQWDAERQEAQKALLGSAVGQQELIDLAFVQVHGVEQSLAWLPDDRRTVALAALEKAGYMAEEEKRMMSSDEGDSLAMIKEGQERQAKILADVLTPAELKDLKMRGSQEAGMLRSELTFFDPTQAEFDALLELREKMTQDPATPRDVYARKAAESEAAKEVLGEERAKEFEQQTDLFYIWSRHAADHYGLPEEVAARAVAVKRDILAAADRIRRHSSLAELDKKRELAGLKAQASAQLNDVLGEKAARFVRKGDGAWLQILDQRTEP